MTVFTAGERFRAFLDSTLVSIVALFSVGNAVAFPVFFHASAYNLPWRRPQAPAEDEQSTS